MTIKNGKAEESIQFLQDAVKFGDKVYHKNNEFLNHMKDSLVQGLVLSGMN